MGTFMVEKGHEKHSLATSPISPFAISYSIEVGSLRSYLRLGFGWWFLLVVLVCLGESATCERVRNGLNRPPVYLSEVHHQLGTGARIRIFLRIPADPDPEGGKRIRIPREGQTDPDPDPNLSLTAPAPRAPREGGWRALGVLGTSQPARFWPSTPTPETRLLVVANVRQVTWLCGVVGSGNSY